MNDFLASFPHIFNFEKFETYGINEILVFVYSCTLYLDALVFKFLLYLLSHILFKNKLFESKL